MSAKCQTLKLKSKQKSQYFHLDKSQKQKEKKTSLRFTEIHKHTYMYKVGDIQIKKGTPQVSSKVSRKKKVNNEKSSGITLLKYGIYELEYTPHMGIFASYLCSICTYFQRKN